MKDSQRGLDDLSLSEVGLKPLNMTEAQKKKKAY